MSLPRPSGLKQPSRIGRPSGLPTARPQTPTAGNPATYQTPQNATPSLATRAHSPESQHDGDSTDDFKIGDRIWVNGNKPGVIAFIGETQFAPGDWAGVVLDEAIGKNDGSVMGIRYFQCEAKRGVFSRLSKLSHTQRSPSQGNQSPTSESKLSHSELRPSGATVTTATSNGISGPTSLSARPPSRLGLGTNKNLSTSSSSLHKSSPAGVTPTGVGIGVTPLRLPGTMPGGVRVGDRVLVSGSKSGVLRYIGETDFAKGVWAGVELDEPQGKNDGAVAGKRYFDCKPLHGLFAPVHKISRAGSLTSTPSPHSRPLMSTSLRSSREHSGSQESMLSLSSTASSVSRSRVRLGVTSLANQVHAAFLNCLNFFYVLMLKPLRN
jgi:CAP-Gly domain-containing linker protein 1